MTRRERSRERRRILAMILSHLHLFRAYLLTGDETYPRTPRMPT
jgi:hypothetical protein